MITTHRHRPAWRRWSPHALRLATIRDALIAERAFAHNEATARAIARATRALSTAVAECARD